MDKSILHVVRRQLVDKFFRKDQSFKTLDLSASNEFTCNFENGPLGLQFGDGVREDGEKFEVPICCKMSSSEVY